MTNILDFFSSLEGIKGVEGIDIYNSGSDSGESANMNTDVNMNTDAKVLTSLQRAQKKYMKKYRQREEVKIYFNEKYKEYYTNNKEVINERRRNKLKENPEFKEKEKARLRECARIYREKKKLESVI